MAERGTIDVSSNIESIIRELDVLPDKLEDYIADSLNVGMGSSRIDGVRNAAAARRTQARYIDDRMTEDKATPGFLAATVTFETKPLNTHKLGLTPQQALAYYGGARASNVSGGTAQPFVATFVNGSTHNVVRLPKSSFSLPKYVRKRQTTGDPAADKRRKARGMGGYRKTGTIHRRNRLPIASIKIFIGRETIKTFTQAMETIGVQEFEDRFYRLLQKGWSVSLIRFDFKDLLRRRS